MMPMQHVQRQQQHQLAARSCRRMCDELARTGEQAVGHLVSTSCKPTTTNL